MACCLSIATHSLAHGADKLTQPEGMQLVARPDAGDLAKYTVGFWLCYVLDVFAMILIYVRTDFRVRCNRSARKFCGTEPQV